MEKDILYMKEALKEAEKAYQMGEIPIGAVIVHEGEIIARAHNLVEHENKATKHAEMIAIEQASESLGWRLEEAVLYCTLEPCLMCTGAMVYARIKRLVFALEDPKRGFCGSIENYLQDSRLNHQVAVSSGILREESLFLMQDFFRKIRKREIPKVKDLKNK